MNSRVAGWVIILTCFSNFVQSYSSVRCAAVYGYKVCLPFACVAQRATLWHRGDKEQVQRSFKAQSRDSCSLWRVSTRIFLVAQRRLTLLRLEEPVLMTLANRGGEPHLPDEQGKSLGRRTAPDRLEEMLRGPLPRQWRA